MVMGVVLSGVLEAINTLPLATDPTNSQCWINIGTMGILAWLSWQAPGMAAGLLAGSPSLSTDSVKTPSAPSPGSVQMPRTGGTGGTPPMPGGKMDAIKAASRLSPK